MADAMVTARMSQEKKEAGNRMLEQLGNERLASGEPPVRLRAGEERAAVP